MDERMRELERKSRAAFDESVEALPAQTRSRLARSRALALGELRERRVNWRSPWLPAGVAAAAALASVLVLTGEERAAQPAGPALAAIEDLDIVTDGEDLGMFDEDADFYAWAVDQAAGGVG